MPTPSGHDGRGNAPPISRMARPARSVRVFHSGDAGAASGRHLLHARNPFTCAAAAVGNSRTFCGFGMTAGQLGRLIAATGFLALLAAPHTLGVAAGYLVLGMFSAPMTVWAQSLRMARIPAPLFGRGFAVLRTLMQATLLAMA